MALWGQCQDRFACYHYTVTRLDQARQYQNKTKPTTDKTTTTSDLWKVGATVPKNTQLCLLFCWCLEQKHSGKQYWKAVWTPCDKLDGMEIQNKKQWCEHLVVVALEGKVCKKEQCEHPITCNQDPQKRANCAEESCVSTLTLALCKESRSTVWE